MYSSECWAEEDNSFPSSSGCAPASTAQMLLAIPAARALRWLRLTSLTPTVSSAELPPGSQARQERWQEPSLPRPIVLLLAHSFSLPSPLWMAALPLGRTFLPPVHYLQTWWVPCIILYPSLMKLFYRTGRRTQTCSSPLVIVFQEEYKALTTNVWVQLSNLLFSHLLVHHPGCHILAWIWKYCGRQCWRQVRVNDVPRSQIQSFYHRMRSGWSGMISPW